MSESMMWLILKGPSNGRCSTGSQIKIRIRSLISLPVFCRCISGNILLGKCFTDFQTWETALRSRTITQEAS